MTFRVQQAELCTGFSARATARVTGMSKTMTIITRTGRRRAA